MNIDPIKTDGDYRRTLAEIETLMTAGRDTPEGDRLDVLTTLVEAWEARHYPLDLPDPVAAILYHMEQGGLAPKDLVPYIGGHGRVHEVLNRKRPLSLRMIQRLHRELGIPRGVAHQVRRRGVVLNRGARPTGRPVSFPARDSHAASAPPG